MRLNLSLGINPIIVKELRSRMREARAFVTLTGVLLLLGVVSYLIYRMTLATTTYISTPVSPQIGQTLFLTLAFLELLMVCFIAPAVTAGAISGEQEKLTYEMLLATPLRPASILWGKLVSALSYVFLLIFAAIPMASLIFIFGGVALRDMAKALIILVTVAVTLGVFGLFMSALFKRTSRATVLTYLVVALVLFGTIFLYIALGVIRQSEPARWILIANPISAMISALSPSMPFDSPIWSSFAYPLMSFGGGGLGMLGGATISQTSIPRPLYHYSLPLYGGLTLLLYVLTTRLVRTTRRWHVSWRDAATAVALFGAFGGAVVLAFTGTAGRYENVSIFQAATPAPFMVEQGVAVERIVEVAPEPPLEEPPGEITATPTPTPAEPPTPAPTPFEPGNMGLIYAAVIRHMYLIEFGRADLPENTVLYVAHRTDDSFGDPNTPTSDEQLISAEVQEAASAALADLPLEVRWIEERSRAPVDEEGHIADGGRLIVLGNLHIQSGTEGTVSGLITNNQTETGWTFIINYENGSWLVAGDTGYLWEK
jgi:ABC-2 type transport system permease protein